MTFYTRSFSRYFFGRVIGQTIAQHMLVIGTVARLEYQKNLERFIALAGRNQSAGTIWIILGSGSMKDALLQLINASGLAQSIFIIDTLDVPARFVSAFDIFVCTSRYEGFPYAIMEAMAAGIPVVSTNVGGLREMIHHGRSGFLVEEESENEHEIDDRVQQLLSDVHFRRELGAHAQEDCRYFKIDRMICETKVVYDNNIKK